MITFRVHIKLTAEMFSHYKNPSRAERTWRALQTILDSKLTIASQSTAALAYSHMYTKDILDLVTHRIRRMQLYLVVFK